MVLSEHNKIKKEIMEFIKSKYGYSFPESTSMPLGCSRNTRIYIPDIVVLKDNNIKYIIEPESSTGGTPICGKIVLANKSIEKMVKTGLQSPNVKPKLIFLYKPSFSKNKLERVKYRVNEAEIQTNFLQEVFIDYFPAKWSWLKE